MSENSTRFIVSVLTVFTAVVHLVILNLGGLQILFLLNGLGYFGLLGALLLRYPRNRQALLHYAFMAYALATIVAWMAMGTRDALGYSTKLVEVLLIIFLWLNLQRVKANKA